MLVLTRLKNDEIVIQLGDDKVVVSIQGIKGPQVSVGITAPRHVIVDRREIYESKKRAKEAAKE